MIPRELLAIVAFAAAGAAHAAADEMRDAGPAAGPVVGASTREWLSMQRANAQAGRSHALDGEVAAAIYRRYLDSFRGANAAAKAPAAADGAPRDAAAAKPR